MSNLDSLIAQRRELDAQITAAKWQNVQETLALIAARGLTLADLQPPKKPGVNRNGSVPVKYRDASGNTWTGRGIKPRWLAAAIAAGATLESFAV